MTWMSLSALSMLKISRQLSRATMSRWYQENHQHQVTDRLYVHRSIHSPLSLTMSSSQISPSWLLHFEEQISLHVSRTYHKLMEDLQFCLHRWALRWMYSRPYSTRERFFREWNKSLSLQTFVTHQGSCSHQRRSLPITDFIALIWEVEPNFYDKPFLT